jgi:phenylpyruvate tautomerase PptA (4-oxalocrotonate tautomerase family)
MPVFNAHIPKGRFTREQKVAIGRSLNLSLVEGLGIPQEDQFVMISEHADDELFIHPTHMGMDRTANAMIITVMLGAHRPLSDKQALMAAITRLLNTHVGISPDDVFITLVPIQNENFSFGRGVAQLADIAPQW